MDVSEGLKILGMQGKSGLHNTLGVEFISTPDPDSYQARMPVDERNTQPFGYLNGGASLAFAETVAGVGTYSLCPEKVSFGMSVTGNHVHAVRQGGYVTAKVILVHKGRSSHIWRVEISDSDGRLASVVTVTNFVGDDRK